MNKIYFWAILTAGTLLRLFYILDFSHKKNCDICTIGLMAKHILEGEFPIFFYGQYYLGPIEAVVTAFFFIIFGIKTQAIYLSVLFFSFLFTISIYFLGKALGNAKTGLIAMLYAAFPPSYFFWESVMPLGYHIEIPLFGTLILIIAVKICAEDMPAKKTFYYLLLGALAGIGFWTHYIILYYILPAGVYLLLKDKTSSLVKNGIAAVAAGILASLPFWVFTLQNNFCTFQFPYSEETRAGYSVVFEAFFYNVASMLGFNINHLSWFRFVMLIFYAFMVIYFILNAVSKRSFCSREMLLVFFFFTVSCIYIFYRAKTYTWTAYYYLIPIISFIPVCFAYFTNRILRWNRFAGLFILFCVISLNILDIGRFIRSERQSSEQNRLEYFEKIKFLNKIKINKVYGHDRFLREAEFFSNEKIKGTAYQDGDYFPHEDEIDASNKVAFEIPHGGWSYALDNICKSYKCESGFFFDFRPFPYLEKSILPSNWHAVSNRNNFSAWQAFDRNYDSSWQTDRGKYSGDYFKIDLGRSYKLCSLVMINLVNPCGYIVELSEDGLNWKRAVVMENIEPLFWSGPRIYWRSVYGRTECFFKPQGARYVRLTNIKTEKTSPWAIQEIFIYEYLGERSFSAKEYVKDIRKILLFLKQQKLSFVYADYWPSAKIKRLSEDSINTFVSFNTWRPYRKGIDRKIFIDGDKVILTESKDAAETESLLKEFGIEYKKKVFDKYVCHYFSGLGENPIDIPSFFWGGFSVLKYSLKDYSRLFYEKGDYEKALRYYTNNFLAYLKLKNLPKTKYYPEAEMPINFANGIKLLGYSIRSKNIKPGKVIRVEYFWELKSEPKSQLSVFVYFMKDNKIVFQNDHAFMYQFPRPISPLEGERFREVLKLKIPENIEKGLYQIVMGLWDEINKKRIKIKDLKKKRVSKFTAGELVVE